MSATTQGEWFEVKKTPDDKPKTRWVLLEGPVIWLYADKTGTVSDDIELLTETSKISFSGLQVSITSNNAVSLYLSGLPGREIEVAKWCALAEDAVANLKAENAAVGEDLVRKFRTFTMGAKMKTDKAESELLTLRDRVTFLEGENTQLRTQNETEIERLNQENRWLRAELNRVKVSSAKDLKRRIPKVGDPVLSHWQQWQFFKSTIASFNPADMTFTVNWADNDVSHRTQPVKLVALDRTPSVEDIGIGTHIIFPQGRYRQDERNDAGQFYHLGIVTHINIIDGVRFYRGHHLKGREDGKRILMSYQYEFDGLKLEDLRVAPNEYDLLMAQDSITSQITGNVSKTGPVRQASITSTEQEDYDVFLHFHSGGPKCEKGPKDLSKFLSDNGLKVYEYDGIEDDVADFSVILQILQNSRVFVACVSNTYANSQACSRVLQYVVKTLSRSAGLAVLPALFEPGKKEFQETVVGLLITGEFCVDFAPRGAFPNAKIEISSRIVELLPPDSGRRKGYVELVGRRTKHNASDPTDFFISYAPENSFDAFKSGHVAEYKGTPLCDPRHVASLLQGVGHTVWIDTERIKNGPTVGGGYFEQLSQGLRHTRCVLAFVSTQYADNENSRMVLQFAAKTIRKPIVALIVGSADDTTWQQSTVGMIVASNTNPPIALHNVAKDSDILSSLSSVRKTIKSLSNDGKDLANLASSVSRAPQPRDKVISHWKNWEFFSGTIETFDKLTMTYTINWDDGGANGRTQPYNLVALNKPPSADAIGVGTQVIFKQGRYKGTDGLNAAGEFYHLGLVTKVYRNATGDLLYDGIHAKGVSDGKPMRKSYEPGFVGHKLGDLRVAPNAMDTLVQM
eukprot:m.30333 g.30333  ORF g.30333 m.30333 type:complete len:853 (+) comp8195_c0_seq1:160-2718(+)